MQANKKSPNLPAAFLMLLGLVFLPLGCLRHQRAVEAAPLYGPAGAARAAADLRDKGWSDGVKMSKRFQESASQGPTVVESTIELAKRFTDLTEETAVLRQKSRDVITENHRLKKQIDVLEPKLQQTQKELAEANDLLIEMHIELNNWKIDILGFRNEMRGAEKAQLEALLKIYKILGGEVKVESTQGENANATVVRASESSRPLPPTHQNSE